MKTNLLVSVSGGRTSALMAKLLWDRCRNEYEMIFVFANTSREREETLIFVDQLNKIWGLPIIWVEAVVHEGRVGTTHSIVTFETAKRNGEVFESVIQKYGIPNKKYIHCTRDLKSQPIKSYARSLGWNGYETAIGFRRDEPKRVNFITAEKNKHFYPLYEWGITKNDVNVFFSKQKFDLQLLEYEGNCKLCYKKSKRKLLTQIITDPNSCDWIADMESKYRYYQKEGRDNSTIKDGTLFFRNSESIHDLISESKQPFERWVTPINIQSSMFDIELDEQDSCAENCEPFSDGLEDINS